MFCGLTMVMYWNLTGNLREIPKIVRATVDNNTLAVLMKKDRLLEQKMLLINKTFHTLLRAHSH
jgi:hypothetical protein